MSSNLSASMSQVVVCSYWHCNSCLRAAWEFSSRPAAKVVTRAERWAAAVMQSAGSMDMFLLALNNFEQKACKSHQAQAYSCFRGLPSSTCNIVLRSPPGFAWGLHHQCRIIVPSRLTLIAQTTFEIPRPQCNCGQILSRSLID